MCQRKRMSYLSGKVQVWFSRTRQSDYANVVEEDVGFGPENIGVPTDEIWQRVDYALRAVGMTKYRTHSPTSSPEDRSSVWQSRELWQWSQNA